MKILVIDTEHNELIVHEADRVSLQDYYKLLYCDLIDMATRVIGDEKREYTIVCDDEGLFKDKRIVSAMDSDYNTQFVNSIAITRTDDEGNDIGLDDSDIGYIKKFVSCDYRWNDYKYKYEPYYTYLNKCNYPE